MKFPQVHRLSFGTSYRQFYLVDRDFPFTPEANDFWTAEALERRLAVGEGVIGIGTASYGLIRCFFQTDDSEPTLPLSPWQRVVEGSIRLTKGRYSVLDCPDSNVTHEGICAPGEYRLRVYGAFLDEVVEDTHGDDYFDFYWLVLWPAAHTDPRVLKV